MATSSGELSFRATSSSCSAATGSTSRCPGRAASPSWSAVPACSKSVPQASSRCGWSTRFAVWSSSGQGKEEAELPSKYGRFENAIRRWERGRLEVSWHYANPPAEYARNTHVLSWWSPQHDALLKELIEEHAWAWQSNLSIESIEAIDPPAYKEWTETDPLCERYASYNVMRNFAAARAESEGFTKLLPKRVVRKCVGCGQDFASNSVPGDLASWGGGEFCAVCLYRAFVADGDHLATEEKISQWILGIVAALQRIPPQGIILRPAEELPPPGDPRTASILGFLAEKPALECIRKHFGSWFEALMQSGAVEASGMRLSRGTRCLGEDGHVCSSIGEKTIDDLLHSAGIEHEREPAYPEGNYRADFKVGETLIEFFGLTGNADYDAKSEIKRGIASRNKVTLIEVFPRDLADTNRLISGLKQSMERRPT